MKKVTTIILACVALAALTFSLGCEPPHQPKHDDKHVCPCPRPCPKPSPCPCPGPCPKPAPKPEPTPKAKVLAFTASWCGPCQRSKPFLAEIKASGVDVQIVDIDEQPDLAQQYGVTSVPTFFVHVNGKSTLRTQDISVVVSLTKSD
ncbi:MAG: thioredoxin family protein [Thermoguttaceae bacterium]